MRALAAEDTALALGLFAPLPPTSLAEPVSYEIFNWIEPTMALPDAARDPNYWPAGNWRCLRSLNLSEWDPLRAWRSNAARLDRADERPEPHFADALLAVMDGDFPGAAAAYKAAAAAYAVLGDTYHEIRHAAMSLWCRSCLGVDDAVRADMQLVAEAARRVGSPYMTAFGIGGPASAPTFVLEDPERALELVDEAIFYAVQSRNQFAQRTVWGTQVLALTVQGDPAALPRARDILTATRNNNQITLQLGSLSVAFSALGHHHEAAQIIGHINTPGPAYTYWRNISRVVAAWNDTRQALGDDAYQAARSQGAALSYEELLSWLQGVLDDLSPSAVPPR
jgi:hypothetical protein